jgi:HK97 family phage major capsid protein
VKKRALPGEPGIRFMPVQSIRKLEARAGDAEDVARYEVAFSSEFEVERQGWFGTYREVLDHSPGAVDMTRFESGTAAVLEEHRGVPIGVIESASIDQKDKMGRAVVRFSPTQRGRDAQMDVDAEVRMNISVGYMPKRAKLIEENEERGDLWKITRWMPVELSLVGVPADPSVGVGRSAGESWYPQVEIEDNPQPEVRRMPDVDLKKEGVEAERARVKALAEIATTAGMPAERVTEWIEKGSSVEMAQADAIKHLRTKGEALKPEDPLEGLSDGDRARYSYARAIAQAADDNLDGIEGEVHKELVRKHPTGLSSRGANKISVLVPMRLREQSWAKRTLDSKTVAKGSELVFEQPGELIELFRNRSYVLQLGARLLTGLSAPIAFPRQTGGMTVFWVSENPGVDVTASDPALGLATLIPKTLQGTTSYSRQFLVQASIDAEMWIRDELAIAHGLAIDRAAIHGLGANGEPTGIYKQTGVNSVAFGGTVANYGKLVDMQTAVANQNALAGATAYMTCPTAAGKMKQTLDFSASAAGRPIWDGPFDNGIISGYKAVATNQVSAVMAGSEATGGTELGTIFGNWMDLIVGLFASMEIIVDPYAQKKRGLIEVTSFQMCDELIRHPESFTKSTGAN